MAIFAQSPKSAQFLVNRLVNRHLGNRRVNFLASAQDWARAQGHGGDRKSEEIKVQDCTLINSKDRATESGASLRTQKMADQVAKSSPALAIQVAHGEKSLPEAVEELTGKRPGAKKPTTTPAPTEAPYDPREDDAAEMAAIVASAQDWARAQTSGRPVSGQDCPLTTTKDRAAASGAHINTQKMADQVAKASPELAIQVAHGEKSLPEAVEELTGKRPGSKKPATPAFPCPAPPSRAMPAFPCLARPGRALPAFPGLAAPRPALPAFPGLAAPRRAEPSLPSPNN